MGIEQAVERGAEAAGFVRRVGSTWAIALVVTALSGMFVVDRLAMADRYVTAEDFRSFKEAVATSQGQYRAQVDAALEILSRRIDGAVEQSATNSTTLAVTAKGIEAIKETQREIKESLKTLIERR